MKPRFSLVPTLAVIAVVAITAALGFWQLDRARGKQALADQARAALAAPPIEIDATPRSPESVAGRRLTARGQWDLSHTVFLDNRTHAGRAGFHVFMALRLAGDDVAPRYLLVQRGWVAADRLDRTRVPRLQPAEGAQRVTGTAVLALEQAVQLGSAPPPAERGQIWQAVTREDFAAWSGLALQPFILREQGDGDDGIVREWPEPADDVAMHRGYALQWFLIGLAAVLMWAWAGLRRPVDRAGSEHAANGGHDAP
ncbi:MAG: SURF1 family protein [Burkholderiaceae bacterium]